MIAGVLLIGTGMVVVRGVAWVTRQVRVVTDAMADQKRTERHTQKLAAFATRMERWSARRDPREYPAIQKEFEQLKLEGQQVNRKSKNPVQLGLLVSQEQLEELMKNPDIELAHLQFVMVKNAGQMPTCPKCGGVHQEKDNGTLN